MKHALTALLVAGLAGGLWAQTSIGAKVTMRGESQSSGEAQSLNKTSNFDLEVGPVLSFMVKKNIEFAPGLSLLYNKTDTLLNNSFFKRWKNQFGIGASADLHYHFIRNVNFSLSSGIDLYWKLRFAPFDDEEDVSSGARTKNSHEDYFDSDLGFNAPLNLDFFRENKKCWIRLSIVLFGLHDHYKFDSSKSNNFEFYGGSIFSPTLQFLCWL